MPEVVTTLQTIRMSDQSQSSKDQKGLTPVSNQKKTCAMVAKSSKDGEEACTCGNV